MLGQEVAQLGLARGDAGLVVLAEGFVAGLTADLVGDVAPEGAPRNAALS